MQVTEKSLAFENALSRKLSVVAKMRRAPFAFENGTGCGSLLLVPEAGDVVGPFASACLARHMFAQLYLFGCFFRAGRAVQSAGAGQLYKHRGVVVVISDQMHQGFCRFAVCHNSKGSFKGSLF